MIINLTKVKSRTNEKTLIKFSFRLVKSLKLARQELVNHPRLGGLERAIYSIIRNTEYPDEQDLEGVAISLARVQFTYRLDPLDMAKGIAYHLFSQFIIKRYVIITFVF